MIIPNILENKTCSKTPDINPQWLKPNLNAEALDGKFRDLHRGVVGLGDDARHLVPRATEHSKESTEKDTSVATDDRIHFILCIYLHIYIFIYLYVCV